MAWTIEEYNALKSAIATGAKTVKYADKEVTYRSLEEMAAILRAMAEELGLNDHSGNRKYPSFTKGTT